MLSCLNHTCFLIPHLCWPLPRPYLVLVSSYKRAFGRDYELVIACCTPCFSRTSTCSQQVPIQLDPVLWIVESFRSIG
ncbi:hypothetical protein GQ457_17G007240 [Hibiscus cannabinus]